MKRYVSERLKFNIEVNDKATDNSVSEGFIAPRGTSTAYAVTTPTARFPFSWFCQQSEANISGCWLFVFIFHTGNFASLSAI
ncbi:hypothetical protein A6J64_009980 [Yersinia enterocolitica]|nr:hypothetical protein A6J64_009980 [Yersinia enterocolitica]RLZ00210.1 hypothetical protein COO51_08975 [Yersinia enterocolitica]